MIRQAALLFTLLMLLSGCGKTPTETALIQEPHQEETTVLSEIEEESSLQMEVTVNGKNFTAAMEDNAAVKALWEILPVTLDLSDYAGWEKVGPLGCHLPTSNVQLNTVPGDIVLFNGDQIVVFYGNNSWSYTKLGHIDDLNGWEEALGRDDVSITFSKN